MRLLFLLVLERSMARRSNPFPFSLLHSLPPCLLVCTLVVSLGPVRLEPNQTQFDKWLLDHTGSGPHLVLAPNGFIFCRIKILRGSVRKSAHGQHFGKWGGCGNNCNFNFFLVPNFSPGSILTAFQHQRYLPAMYDTVSVKKAHRFF